MSQGKESSNQTPSAISDAAEIEAKIKQIPYTRGLKNWQVAERIIKGEKENKDIAKDTSITEKTV